MPPDSTPDTGRPAAHHARHGVIVLHAFAEFAEGTFLEDPALIDRLLRAGERWRLGDAVLLGAAPYAPLSAR